MSGSIAIREPSTPAYFSRRAMSAALRARDDDVAECGRDQLPVDVPDPRDVGAVGDAVVQGDHRVEVVARAARERRERLVGPCGVLDQQHDRRAIGERDPLEAPERRAEARQPVRDVLEGRAERERDARRREGVLDVVQAGHGELDATVPSGVRRSNATVSSPRCSICEAAIASSGRA